MFSKTVRRTASALTLAGLLAASSAAVAAPPARVPVQGVLTTSEGAPVDGAIDVVFTFYEDAQGQTILWSESQSVTFEDGFFTTYLGASMPPDLALFRDHQSVYLGVTVGEDEEMALVEIATAPYAAYAEHAGEAATLGGQAPNAFAAADHAHGFAELSDVPADLADGDDDTTYGVVAGGGLELSNEEFGLLSSCTTDEVLKRTATGWACAADAQGDPVAVKISTVTLNGTTLEITEGSATYTADLATLVGDPSNANELNTAVVFDGTNLNVTDAGGTLSADLSSLQDSYTAGSGLALSGNQFSVDTNQIQARIVGTCSSPGEFFVAVGANGTPSCQSVFGTDGRLTTTTTIAGGFQPDNLGHTGVVIESTASEHGGFFANGNTTAIWSPGDSTAQLAGSPVTSVLLALYDEDNIQTGFSDNATFTFSTSDTRRFAHRNGAYLSAGGVWTNTSDREVKTNVQAIDNQKILETLATIDITKWSYIEEVEEGFEHIGPMAQDFYAAFGLGYEETSIPTVDADGVALAAIQALRERNLELKERVSELEDKLSGLEARLSALESR